MNCASTERCFRASRGLARPGHSCRLRRPEAADPDQARETLSLALDAWHDGRSIDDVTNGSPPITVADPSWKAGSSCPAISRRNDQGRRLRPEDPGRALLQDPKGKAVREKVKYTVSIQPARTVIRSPF